MSREVELIVKLRDEASRLADTIVNSLNDLTKAQKDVGGEAKSTGTLLSQLGKEFKDLSEEAKRLTSLDKIASGLKKSADTVKGLETSVKAATVEFAHLARESAAAATNANKLRGSLEAETKALRENKDAQRSVSSELTAANRAVQQADARLTKYNETLKQTQSRTKGVGLDVGAPQTSARTSASAFLSGDLESARASQSALAQQVAQQAQIVKQSESSVASLKNQLQVAAKEESVLADQAERASAALSKGRDNLTRARSGYSDLGDAAQRASTSLQGLAVDQDAIAKSASRTAAELARVQAAIAAASKFSTGNASGGFTDPKTAAALQKQNALVNDARDDFKLLESEVGRLAREMSASGTATKQQTDAFDQMVRAARAAKTEFNAQQAALAKLQGSTKSSFLAFSQAAGGFKVYSADALRANAASKQLAGSSQQAAGALKPIGPAAQAAGAGLNSGARGASSFREAIKGVYGDSRASLSLLQRIRGEVLSLTASYIGLQAGIGAIKGVVDAFQQLQGAQTRLSVAFGKDGAPAELQFLQIQADRLGISFGLLSDQYSKFAIAAKTANFTSDATRKIFLSVAEAGRVNKLSTEQLEGVFLALEQMISKGKVSSEELRRQLGDRLPGAFELFAKSVGVSTSALDKMVRQGQVLSDQNTLVAFAQELDKTFGSELADSLKSTSAELGRFQNSIFEAQLAIGKGGFIDTFTAGLRILNEAFKSSAGQAFFETLGAVLARVGQVVIVVMNNFDLLSKVFGALVLLKLNSVFQGLVTSLIAVGQEALKSNAGLFTWSNTLTLIDAKLESTSVLLGRAVGAFSIFTRQSQAAAVTTATVGRATLILQGTLRGITSAAGLAAGAFRLLYGAIGGLPGLILTGVTIAISSWFSSVQQVNTAIDEHQRQMTALQDSYDKVKDKAATWAGAVKSVTISQAQDSLSKLLDGYAQKMDVIRTRAIAVTDLVAKFNGPLGGQIKASLSAEDVQNYERIANLLQKLGSRSISAEGFRNSMDEIARSTKNPDIRAFTIDMQNLLDTTGDDGHSLSDFAKSIVESEAKLRIMTGTATDADKALLSGAKSTDDATDATNRYADSATKVDDAIASMNKSLAQTSEEMQRLNAIDALDKQYQAAVKLATTMGQVNALTQAYNKALDSTMDKQVNANSSIVNRIIGVESGGNPNAANPSSSATGLGQFIQSTWLRMFKQYFPDRAAGLSDAMILELRKDETVSRNMISLYVQENAKILQKAGQATTDANLYLAHFLGPQGALKVLQAAPNAKLSDILDPKTVQANAGILGGDKTASDLLMWAQKKVGVSKEEVAIEKELAETDDKRIQKAQEFHDKLEQDLNVEKDRNDNNGRMTKEMFVQNELQKQLNAAKKAGTELNPQEIADIKAQAAAEYDVKQAKLDGTSAQKDANAALSTAIALSAQRNALQTSFNQAIKGADTSKQAELQTQLDDNKSALQAAIDKAEEMWKAIGGPTADAAIAKLDTLKIKTEQAHAQMTYFGLSTTQVGQLADDFATGLSETFGSFADAIVNGQNAIVALGRAFLQFAANFLKEVAEMILKQMILNALQRFGIPGIGTAHTGGLVGSVAVGTGNSRRGSPIGASFIKYHSGGMAGLRPDEVPTVLKRGEEVLTQHDPRNRTQGGLAHSSSSGSGQPLRQVLVFKEEDIANAMASSHGEKVFLTHLKKNAPTVRQILSR